MRTLLFALSAFFNTIRYGVPILFRAATGSPRLEESARTAPRAWSRALLRAAGVDVTVEGEEHVPESGGCVIVANHQSWFDVFSLAGYLPGETRFVAKKELERVPIFGPAWQSLGHVSIDRGDLSRAIESLEGAAEIVRREHVGLVMFPEGTRSPDGEVKRFKKGAFVLAIKVGVPVVPVAVIGTHEIMKKGSWRVRPGPVRVRIGAPISTEGLDERDRDRLTLAAREAVVGLRRDGALEASPEVTPLPRPPGGSMISEGGAGDARPASGEGD